MKAIHVIKKSSFTVIKQNLVLKIIINKYHINYIYGDIVPGQMHLFTAHA
jgi:hypothetical protein